jgi:SSS family solute:Na+ symporter
MTWQLAALLVYAAAMVGVGLWIGKQVKTAGAFFVAGRQLSPFLLFTTLLAANIGAGSTVGAASLGYRDGVAAWWWVGSAALGTFVLAFVVGPRLWRLAKEHDLRTVGDYLELRYGPAVRGLVAALLWLGTLAILAGQLIALAWVLHVMAGVPKVIGCLIGGLVMTSYFVAGGLLTSAWVNVVQLVVLLLGFFLALPLALQAAGGWTALRVAEGVSWQPWGNGSSGWQLLFLLGPAFMVSPGLLQKVYGARSESAVRRGAFWCGVALLVFACVPPLLGMAARSLHPGLEHPDLALPTLLVHDMPPILGLLGLAAVVSAEVSTADALLFMLATSLSQDLYRRFLRPNASDRDVLRVARLAAVAGGILGVLLATVLADVIGALSLFYSVLSLCLFVPIVGGLLWRRAGQRAAIAAIATGVGVWALLRFGVVALPDHALAKPDLVAQVAAALAFVAAAAFPRRDRPDRLAAPT